VFCFLVALFGVWWIVYFCRARVKAAFREAGISQQVGAGGRRVVS
jgi:hypothetical protein